MNHRRTRLIAIALLMLALGAPVSAAPKPPARDEKPKQPTMPVAPTATPAPAVRSYREMRLEQLDDEIAALLQRRGDPGVDAPMLELQIDLRVLARQVAAALGDKLEGRPETAAAYLRVQHLLGAAREVEAVARTIGVPTPAQTAAMKKLHDLTYAKLDASTVVALDATCKEVGGALGTLIPVTEASMRPPQVIAPVEAPRDGADEGGLTALTATARKSNVTAPLRRQLLALADAAQVATVAGNEAEARTLTDGLAESVDLAVGLQTNTAVDLATRQRIESELAEGLALFTDVRTRDSGRRRLKPLQPYRQTLARVGRIKENPDAAKLGALFVWAQEHPEEGAKALSAVEAYNRVCATFAARTPTAALPPSAKRSADALLRQFAGARATFMSDAQELGTGGIMAPAPRQLDEDVSAMSAALETLALVESSPKALETLLAHKPRPVGAIEKRMAAALMGVAGEGKLPADEAVASLRAMKAVADASSRFGAGLESAIPASVAGAWANGSVGQLEAKLKAMVGAAASTLATGDTVDADALARLRVAADVCDALRAAGEIDEKIAGTGPLVRWADWGIGPQQADAILKPYRDATGVAVDGIINDSTTAVSEWPKIRRKYAPFVACVGRVSVYAPACASLPGGAAGAIARLNTPLAIDRFGDVRLAGHVIGIWASAEALADLTTADEAARVLGRLFKAE